MNHGAFGGCSALTQVNIPESVTNIGGWAFSGCSSLTEVTIPNSVTDIGDKAFGWCSSLTKVTVLATTPPALGSSVFTNVNSGYTVNVPSLSAITYVKADGWKDLKLNVIRGNCGDDLTWVLSDDGTLTIFGTGKKTDYNQYKAPWYLYCYYSKSHSIKTVVIESGVTSIGIDAFNECSVLTQVHIPESVTSIGTRAFRSCSSITEINIPNGVISIGVGAFSSCKALTQVNIPSSVTSIGNAFYYCSKLTNINVENSNTVYSSVDGVLFSKDKTTLVQYPIGKNETTYSIPDGVTSIGEEAFYHCASLKQVTIPSSVTNIADDAFYYCTALTQITVLGDTPPTIDNYTFYKVDKSIPVYVPDESVDAYKTAKWGGFENFRTISEYEALKAGKLSGTCGDNLTWTLTTADNTLTISGTGDMTDYKYNTEAPWIFYNSYIKNVVIEEGATSIGNYAFDGCSAIELVSIPISVTLIGDYAFSDCSALTQMSIPNSVTNIAGDTFKGCSALTNINVEIGSTAYSSENGVLFNKDKTTIVRYPMGKTETTYTIPDGVTSIGAGAFSDCTTLKQINIPESVKSIEQGAFEGCSALTQIIVLGTTPPSIDNGIFSKVDKSIPVYVPAESLEAYKTAEYWSEFTNFIALPEDDDSALDQITLPESIRIAGGAICNPQGLRVVVYDISGRVVYSGTDAAIGGLRGLCIIRCGNAAAKALF